MKRIATVLLAATPFAVPACSNDISSGGGPGPGSGPSSEWDQVLAARVTDYSAALRIAALRLIGDLPSMTEIRRVAAATGDAQRAAYQAVVRDYMIRPAFASQMFAFWRDAFKLGGTLTIGEGAAQVAVDLDTAPAFAAKLTVENGSYLDLFTKASGNCPTFDRQTGTFKDGECSNGGPKAGVLTTPGAMAQFFSNFAFRRVRWIQETFDCLKFPAELSDAPTDVSGAAPYLGVWPFSSIASPSNGGGRVDFQDVSAVVCANCHSTINHIAPLFAYYDDRGVYHDGMISVPTPLDKSPPAQRSDYLPPTETTAWRYGKTAADIPALGAAMAADPGVAKCGVARIWNWALGKEDIVDQLVEVPEDTIRAQLDAFTRNGFKMKDLVFAVFTSDAFVKF